MVFESYVTGSRSLKHIQHRIIVLHFHFDNEVNILLPMISPNNSDSATNSTPAFSAGSLNKQNITKKI